MKLKTVSILLLSIGLVAAGYAKSLAVSAPAADQPKMQAALSDLMNAQRELQVAEHNKGGHRTKALNLTNRAIAAVQEGIEFDRTHDSTGDFPVAEAASSYPDQPHMQAALSSLQHAQDNLQQATATKGGYRVKAMNLVAEAIAQVNMGIAAGR